MTIAEIERLRFRRQYLLTPFSIDCPFQHNYYALNANLHLYTHTDLVVTIKYEHTRKLILLGDMFDFDNPGFGNSEILNELIKWDFKNLLTVIARYCGRYVLICDYNGRLNVVHDAAASRKVYYYVNSGTVCLASQSHLLAKILKFPKTRDHEKLKYYHSTDFVRLIGSDICNFTMYDNIYQLIPNHYLSLDDGTATRYWPNQVIEPEPYDEVAARCAFMIRGYMDSISRRYDAMLPVTAGKDSRILLSATRSFTDRFYYYLNFERRLDPGSQDVFIPQKLFPSLNLQHHLVNPYGEIDPDFKKIYFENDPYAPAAYLPIIYNYYRNFGSRINLPGTFINIIEDVFGTVSYLNGNKLAAMLHLDSYEYAVNYYDKWLAGCSDICERSNLNVLNLYYWEERNANWATHLQLDKDIAQEDIIPYNSRLLIQTMLQADINTRQKPYFLFHREIIRNLWPEALQQPFSMPASRKMLRLTQTLGLMKPAKALYYSFLFQPLRSLNYNRRHRTPSAEIS